MREIRCCGKHIVCGFLHRFFDEVHIRAVGYPDLQAEQHVLFRGGEVNHGVSCDLGVRDGHQLGVKSFNPCTSRSDLQYFPKLTVHLYPVANPEGGVHVERHAAEDVAEYILSRKSDGDAGDAGTRQQRGNIDVQRIQNHQYAKSPYDDPERKFQNRSRPVWFMMAARIEVVDSTHAETVHRPDAEEDQQGVIVSGVDLQQVRHVGVKGDVDGCCKNEPGNRVAECVDKKPDTFVMKIPQEEMGCYARDDCCGDADEERAAAHEQLIQFKHST